MNILLEHDEQRRKISINTQNFENEILSKTVLHLHEVLYLCEVLLILTQTLIRDIAFILPILHVILPGNPPNAILVRGGRKRVGVDLGHACG